MYQRILVPVDGSTVSRRGVDEAIKVAKDSSAEIRVLHVVNELVLAGPYDPVQNIAAVIESVREGGKRVLQDIVQYATSRGANTVPVLVEAIGGRAADRIVEYAHEWPADLIVLGTHGRRGIQRLALGSDAELVARQARMPVLLVRAVAEPKPHI